MDVIKVKRADTAIIDFIVSTLSDNPGERPSKAHLNTLLTDDKTYLFAAIVDDEVAGFTLGYRFPSLYSSTYMAYLYDIEVVETHRRKGIGRRLVETLIEHLKADQVTELWLGTATDNVAGQALFSATGGIKSGEAFNDFTYYLR